MTFLDRTVLDGHRRCQKHQTCDDRYRQCARDEGHRGQCIYGCWLLIQLSVAFEVQELERLCAKELS